VGARFLPTFERLLRWSFYTGGSAKKRVKRRIGADGDLHLSFANLAYQRNV
jgi:hypothetical protein